MRNLLLILGDQLDPATVLLNGFDAQQDAWLMIEATTEATHVWSHKARIALFLAAMRHHAMGLRARGHRLIYRALDHEADPDLVSGLAAVVAAERPACLRMVLAGDWRVQQSINDYCRIHRLPLDVLADTHFYDRPEAFAAWAQGRRELRLEYYYRELRRRHRVLLDGDRPVGGAWNYDAENRASFASSGPGPLPPPITFAPNAITTEVLALVDSRFAHHPGSLAQFDWPLTPEQARAALTDFLDHRLANFGRYQDALWHGEPWLYHSRLSAAMNLKLLPPREVVNAVEARYRSGQVPLAAAEGFIRQILGWREYVRGLYWLSMPQALEENALGASHPLPHFYWTGETTMRCLADTIGQTLRLGYAHHIQRLMITGLYALLYGVAPREVHEWYLAVYVDAVEWVELPNTLGMSQHADGGRMASKPYIASGKYIQRMSNYCAGCRYRPDRSTGADACPYTTLYWDFLIRHRERYARHPRLQMQVRNLDRMSPEQLIEIRLAADAHRASVSAGGG